MSVQFGMAARRTRQSRIEVLCLLVRLIVAFRTEARFNDAQDRVSPSISIVRSWQTSGKNARCCIGSRPSESNTKDWRFLPPCCVICSMKLGDQLCRMVPARNTDRARQALLHSDHHLPFLDRSPCRVVVQRQYNGQRPRCSRALSARRETE